MVMALAQPLRTWKKKMPMFIGPILPFERRSNATAPVLKTEVSANGYPVEPKTLCKQGRLKEALHILLVIDQQVDCSTYNSLLQGCLNNKALPEAKLVHAHIIQTGFTCPDISLSNKLVTMYAKCGSLVEANWVFTQLPERDVVTWSVMIAAYARNGCAEDAMQLFYRMQHSHIQPNPFTFTGVLPACAKLASLEQGKEIHEKIVRNGCQSDVFVGNSLVDMYAKCGSVKNARYTFDKMPQRNVVSYNTMIAGYAQNGHVDEALKLFQKMSQRDVVSWNTMIAAFAQNGHIDEALDLFQKMPEPNVITWNAMIAGYAQNGRVDEALKLFERMPERDMVSWNTMIAGYAQNGHVAEALELFRRVSDRNVVSWTAMIGGYAQNGQGEEALKLFQQMQVAGVKPNMKTFVSVLPACASLEALKKGMEIHEEIIRSGFQSAIFVANSLVDMYAKCGSIENARNVFDKMHQRDVVSWTAMILAYAQNGYDEVALKLFRQMQLAGVKPDMKTFASVLPVCANLAALEQGKEIHEDIIRSGFQLDVFVESALVDMYAKCGSIENARDVFDKIHERNVVSWNVMIAGYATHGFGKEALKLFEQMRHTGTSPDHVTLVCVLSACCHAGLVDEGQKYFNSMSQYYHITPAMEHYGCMVDLLGRAGHLDEAHEFILKMPIKPDATVWGCLLGACRNHSNVELGEQVAECLFELNPKNDTPYVLLSNIYAAAGRWDEIKKVRKMMRDRRVKKKPGCSWIEVNKQVCAFVVGDGLHPQM
eukprot:Gb_07260 [translate_table: standard]